MSDNLTTGIVSVALAVVGVATLAVVMSRQSNAPAVIQAGGSALANNILAAVSPVTSNGGMGMQGNFGYPSSTATAFP